MVVMEKPNWPQSLCSSGQVDSLSQVSTRNHNTIQHHGPAQAFTSRMQIDIRHLMTSIPICGIPSAASLRLILLSTLLCSNSGTFLQFHSGCSCTSLLASSFANSCSL